MRIAALAAVFAIGWFGTAPAQTTYDDPNTPEGWAWAKIRNDEIANLNARCGKEVDPHDKTGWDDSCRQITAKFVEDVLTVPKWRDQLARQRVRLRGAWINGTINLEDTEVTPEVWIDASRIEGRLILDDSHWKRLLSLEGSTIAGEFSGERMVSESSILVRGNAAIEGNVNLRGAKIAGDLKMDTSSFRKAVNADSMSVAGNLFMRGRATFGGDVILRGAKVDANLDMDSSTFTRTVDADRLNVAGSLFMRDHATFAGDVILRGATVGFNLDMDSSSFRKAVNANSMSVKRSLFMRDHATFGGEVSLIGAKIGSNLEMDTSSFAGAIRAAPVNVEGNLLMRNGATFGGEVTLIGAKIGGNLHLWGSTAWRVDLSGADAREFLLAGLGWSCAGGKAPTGSAARAPKAAAKPAPIHWQLGDPSWRNAQCDGTDRATLPSLILRNFHVDALQDSADAWPTHLDLEGFRYERLGGIGGTGRNDMRKRSPGEWNDWLQRDPTFSTQPYAQLSSVLAAAGHRDTSEAIQFAGRERERIEAHGITRAWLTFLSAVNGYGIGSYTVRVIRWVILLTLLGAVFLQLSPAAREHVALRRQPASPAAGDRAKQGFHEFFR
jgi:cytoskeletal protein CcmA (bactofilin family)